MSDTGRDPQAECARLRQALERAENALANIGNRLRTARERMELADIKVRAFGEAMIAREALNT